MSGEHLSARAAALRARRDVGSIDDAQYWAGLVGVAVGYAEAGDIAGAVRCLCEMPEEFLLAIPGSERPLLQEAAVKLADLLRAEGIVAPALPQPQGRPS